MEFCRERRLLEGRADCENGVVGDDNPAAVLEPPFMFGNEVDSGGSDAELVSTAELFLEADRVMYVSTHRATT